MDDSFMDDSFMDDSFMADNYMDDSYPMQGGRVKREAPASPDDGESVEDEAASAEDSTPASPDEAEATEDEAAQPAMCTCVPADSTSVYRKAMQGVTDRLDLFSGQVADNVEMDDSAADAGYGLWDFDYAQDQPDYSDQPLGWFFY